MATRWIVDGMNVIGSRPDGWWRDRTGAVRALAAQLDRFQDETGKEVAVVFDGRPREIPARVDVRFAPRAGPTASSSAPPTAALHRDPADVLPRRLSPDARAIAS